MTSEERAQQYADLFNHYDKTGSNWRHNTPCDATLHGETVYLDGWEIHRSNTGEWVVSA